MDRNTGVAAIIDNVIKQQLGVDSVDTDKPLLDLGMDSLDIIQFQMSLEEEFGMEIPDADCYDSTKESIKLATPADWTRYVISRQDATTS